MPTSSDQLSPIELQQLQQQFGSQFQAATGAPVDTSQNTDHEARMARLRALETPTSDTTQPAADTTQPAPQPTGQGSQAGDSKWQGAADVFNAPGILKDASSLESGFGKLVGGTAINLSNLINSRTKSVQGMEASNQALNEIDQHAVTKAHELAVSGDIAGAKRLLAVVQSHGTNIELSDILPNSGLNSPGDVARASGSTFLQNAALTQGVGLPGAVTEAFGGLTTAAKAIPGVEKAGQVVSDLAGNFPKIAGAIKGGAEASALGGLYGAGGEMTNPNATPGSVVNAGVSGATNPYMIAGGAALGGLGASKFGAKTDAEILATPKSKIGSLSESDRNIWLKNESDAVKNQAAQTSAGFKIEAQQAQDLAETTKGQVKTDLGQVQDAAEKQLKDLNTQLNTGARDTVVASRPSILQGFRNASQKFRSLFEEDMQGQRNAPLNNGELKDYIDSRFPEDPNKAAAVKASLGLTEQVNPLSSQTNPLGTSVKSSLKPVTTIGEAYDQAKSLTQGMSSASRNGSKIFSPADKAADDARGIFMDYLKDEKGLNFDKSNSFWKEYVPTRDGLMKAKPFDIAGQNTGTFENLIKQSANGKVSNDNFFAAAKELTGVDMTADAKATVAKMDNTQRTALAAKVAAEEKIANAEMTAKQAKEDIALKQANHDTATEKKLQDLLEQKHLIERQVANRARFNKILWGVGSAAAGSAITAKVKGLF